MTDTPTSNPATPAEPEYWQCLRWLLTRQTVADYPDLRGQVGQMILNVISQDRAAGPAPSTVERLLAGMGIIVRMRSQYRDGRPVHIVIANRHSALDSIYRNTAWRDDGYTHALARWPDSIPSYGALAFGRERIRGRVMPIAPRQIRAMLQQGDEIGIGGADPSTDDGQADGAPATQEGANAWLIRKRGLFYRPNRAGYTAIMAETMAQQGEPLTLEALRHMIDLTTRVFTDQMDRARQHLLHGRPPVRGTEH